MRRNSPSSIQQVKEKEKMAQVHSMPHKRIVVPQKEGLRYWGTFHLRGGFCTVNCWRSKMLPPLPSTKSELLCLARGDYEDSNLISGFGHGYTKGKAKHSSAVTAPSVP